MKNFSFKKRLGYIYASIFIVILTIIIFFNQLDRILYIPIKTPEMWCEGQPCIELDFFSFTILLVQPTSTFFVYLLGFITLLLGVYFLRISKGNKFVFWWGIALLLWGIGAIFAGTSYQAFSYVIKCAGKGFCVWTSLLEILYLLLSVGSVNAMLLAQANLDEKNKWTRIIKTYALINFLIYEVVVVIGAIIPIQFMISFELMILFLAPTILFLLISNMRNYFEHRRRINLSLSIIYVSLILIIGLYFLYFMLGITDVLWEHQIWFSENDVLHIGLSLWMSYIYITIRKNKKNIEISKELEAL
ncbi:MAG: hypothetical protein EU531_09495 [Promethearchaeota archaeon]|nr:MAG: hypothetical protein EU531_09495 [Candidatus Lokiarchaeota archaeon]